MNEIKKYFVKCQTYFLIDRTGILIDEPGNKTLSATKSSGSRRGISIELAMMNFEVSFEISFHRMYIHIF